MATAGATAQLVDAIDLLRAEDLSSPASGQLKADLLELETKSRALDAERLRRLAEIDRRGDFEDEGYVSTAAWSRDRTVIPHGQALARVEMARRLATMRLSQAAFADGRIGWEAVRGCLQALGTPTQTRSSLMKRLWWGSRVAACTPVATSSGALEGCLRPRALRRRPGGETPSSVPVRLPHL